MREISLQETGGAPPLTKEMYSENGRKLLDFSLLLPFGACDDADSDSQDMLRIYGTDALRFAIAMQPGWPPGPSRLQGALTLANKFWNCLRFACMHLQGDEPLSPDLRSSSDMERWFLQRLNTTTAQLNEHFERNQLSSACARLQYLVRHDLSGWFLESIRLHIGNPASRQCVRYVMLHIAHLLHPLMPNITQETFFRLSTSPQKLFLQHPFPEFRSELIFPQATRRVEQLRKLVHSIRSLMGLHFIPAPSRITVILTSNEPEIQRLILAHAEDICHLAGISNMRLDDPPPGHAIRTVSRSWSISILLDDSRIHDSIRVSLLKEKDDLSRRILRMQHKLGNRGFMDSIRTDTARRWKTRLRRDLRRRERVIRTLGMLTAPQSETMRKR